MDRPPREPASASAREMPGCASRSACSSSSCSGARPGSTCRRSSPRRPSRRRRACSAAASRVGRVTFNPWTLELTIADLALAGAAAGAPPLLEARRVYADVAFVSLLRLAPVIDRLEVDAPMLRVSRIGEGRYDIDDVLQRLAAAAGRRSRRASPSTTSSSRGGGADFVDRPLATTHRVRDLELAIPFVSSLPSEREIKVEPHLAFALDGSRFDSAGAATPFAERGNGELHLKLDGFAVAPYLGYLPRGLPAQLRAATLSADLVVAFEQRPKLSLNVAGVVGATGIEVVDAAANDLLKVGSVKVQIDELRPLERLVRLKQVDIDAPHVVAVRNAAGRVNLLLAAEGTSGTARAGRARAAADERSRRVPRRRRARRRRARQRRARWATARAASARSRRAVRPRRRRRAAALARQRRRARAARRPPRLDRSDDEPGGGARARRLLVERREDRLAARRAGRLPRRRPARHRRRTRQARVFGRRRHGRRDRQGLARRAAAGAAAALPAQRPRAAARGRAERRSRRRLARRRRGAATEDRRRRGSRWRAWSLGDAAAPEVDGRVDRR